MTRKLDSAIEGLLRAALDEDLGANGDITSNALFDEDTQARAEIRAKQSGVMSGTTLIGPLFAMLDPRIVADVKIGDGDRVEAGTLIAALDGPVRGLLAGERTLLNLLQRLSGIATATAGLVAQLKDTNTRLLDTRKTTPLLRSLEKEAVVHGGGHNHRFGLYDMVLIKDTHVRAAGGPGAAVRTAQEYLGTCRTVRIEVEVQTPEELAEALEAGPDRIMLDNMSNDQIRWCVERRRSAGASVELEASGNICAAGIRAVAETGVDFISVGSITHSVPALDIHMVLTV